MLPRDEFTRTMDNMLTRDEFTQMMATQNQQFLDMFKTQATDFQKNFDQIAETHKTLFRRMDFLTDEVNLSNQDTLNQVSSKVHTINQRMEGLHQSQESIRSEIEIIKTSRENPRETSPNPAMRANNSLNPPIVTEPRRKNSDDRTPSKESESTTIFSQRDLQADINLRWYKKQIGILI